MKATFGQNFMAAVVHDADLQRLLKCGKVAHLFTDHEVVEWEFITAHIEAHGVLPAPETLVAHAQTSAQKPTEPASYYLEHMRQRYIDLELKAAVDAANESMGEGPNKNPRYAMNTLLALLQQIKLDEAGSAVSDFREAYSPVMQAYAQQAITGGMFGIQLGWPYLDEMSGGMVEGDLISYIGRPAKGKTWFLLWSAHHAWAQGKRVLFLSMEMKPIRIQQRLAAMTAKVPGMALKLGELTDIERDKLKARMVEIQSAETPFYVVDGAMSATVPELRMLCSTLKPDVVFVDGAYLLQHEDKRLTKFRRIDAVCDQLKQMIASDYGVPCVASWQFNRQSGKKQKDGTPAPVTMDDVYGSDVIAHDSSLILGLLEEDTPEAANTKLIQVLKGREGEVGKFNTKWDFHAMDFSQVWLDDEEESELDVE